MACEPIIEDLIKLDTCAVSDALDSLSLKGATWGVRPQWQCPKIAGRAVTMKIKPAGLQQPTQHLGTAPIEAAQPGDVIVIDNGGKLGCSCWGGLLALSAKLKGVSGVVIDGASRDIDEARELEFPVYARGVVPMTARNRVVQESSDQEDRVRRRAMPSRRSGSRRRQRHHHYSQEKSKKWSLPPRMPQGTGNGRRHPQGLFGPPKCWRGLDTSKCSTKNQVREKLNGRGGRSVQKHSMA